MDYFSNYFITPAKVGAFLKNVQDSYKKYLDESVKGFQESSREMMDIANSYTVSANTDLSAMQEKNVQMSEKVGSALCKIMSRSSMQLSQLMYDISDYFQSIGTIQNENAAAASTTKGKGSSGGGTSNT